MSFIRLVVHTTMCLLPAVLWSSEAVAQGLIWKLPPDGAWVRYEGTYSQTVYKHDDARPDTPPTAEQIEPWTRHLTIRSVGTEEVDVDGTTTLARWLEFEVVTGKERDGRLDPGLTGRRVYKVLVLESRIVGQTHDDNGVLVSFLPILRGYRVIGNGNPEEITATVFHMFPVVSMVRFFRDVVPGETETVDLGGEIGTVNATAVKADEVIERPESRAVYDARLWRSEDIPFGLGRWSLRITEAAKDALAPRDSFQTISETSVEMSAKARGDDAQSVLNVP